MPDHRPYDFVVAGAGPAGLCAARTAARLGFRTIVLERHGDLGLLRRPCSGVLTSVPGFVSGRRMYDGLFLPSLDLLIPPALIVGHAPVQRVISPGNFKFEARFSETDSFPATVVDKGALLRLLAEQASSAGVCLRFNSAATGLVQADGRIVGVQTENGPVLGRVVLAAEGSARSLSEEAGLYTRSSGAEGKDAVPTSGRRVLLLSQDLDAPRVGSGDLGQIVTFGSRYTSARQAFGTVVLPAPNRASVFFTVFDDGFQQHSEQLAWFYMEEYTLRDSRVRELLVGARTIGKHRQSVLVREAPQRAVQDGLMALGDALAPGGHLGILPAMYLGRQAVFVAAEALDAGQPTRQALLPYEQFVRDAVLPNLEAETMLMSCLTQLSDDELDRLCQALSAMPRATPFFSNWRTLTWEMMGWMMRQLPQIVQDWKRMPWLAQAYSNA